MQSTARSQRSTVASYDTFVCSPDNGDFRKWRRSSQIAALGISSPSLGQFTYPEGPCLSESDRHGA